ncbi:MAG: hypothetical protein H7Z37_01500 [Pyrinomonadaceae bacterium]|nr:hypothetical protein [Pyrinomonadaceae bacterium]
MQVTIQISDETYNNFSRIAKSKSKRVDEIISAKLESEFGFDVEKMESEMAYYSDKLVLQIYAERMPKRQDNRLSKLLQMQQTKELTETERVELENLMIIYRVMSLRKVVAFSEAKKRDLAFEEK